MHQKLSETNEKTDRDGHFLNYPNQKPFCPDPTNRRSPRHAKVESTHSATDTAKPNPEVVSAQAVDSKPFPKKIRPNFINLKDITHPNVCTNGYIEGIPQNESQGGFGSAGNGESKEQNKEQQTRNQVVMGSSKGDVRLPSTVHQPSETNGNRDTTGNADDNINGDTNGNSEAIASESSEVSQEKQKLNSSKDAGPPLIPKIISRFVSPDATNSPCDSLCSTDSTPWNIDGTETIVENPFRRSKGSLPSLKSRTPSFMERELNALREENKQLRTSLKEAGRLNGQWRTYHEERQGYVERLLSTIHALHQRQELSTSPPGVVHKTPEEGGAREGKETQRLRESLKRARAEYQEHVTLLQLQVRAHRDDWEAERAEKRLEKRAREEAEEKVALLMQEVQILQQKIKEQENRAVMCRCCGGARDFSAFDGLGHPPLPVTHPSPAPHPSPPVTHPPPATHPPSSVTHPPSAAHPSPSVSHQPPPTTHSSLVASHPQHPITHPPASDTHPSSATTHPSSISVIRSPLPSTHPPTAVINSSPPESNPIPSVSHPSASTAHPLPVSLQCPISSNAPFINNNGSPKNNHAVSISSNVLPTNSHLPLTDSRNFPVNSHVPSTNSHVPSTNTHISPTTNCVSSTNSHDLSINGHVSPSTNRIPPLNSHISPSTNQGPPTNNVPPSTNHIPPGSTQPHSSIAYLKSASESQFSTTSPPESQTPGMCADNKKAPASQSTKSRQPLESIIEPKTLLADKAKPGNSSVQTHANKPNSSKTPPSNRYATGTADESRFLQNSRTSKSFYEEPKYSQDQRSSKASYEEHIFAQSSRPMTHSPHHRREAEPEKTAPGYKEQSSVSAGAVIRNAVSCKQFKNQSVSCEQFKNQPVSCEQFKNQPVSCKQFKNQSVAKQQSSTDCKTHTNCGRQREIVSGTAQYHGNGAANIPLKGWIPVSLMHRIAFGSSGDQRTVLYHKSPPISLPSESPSPNFKNYSSPSLSRESSLTSCSSPDDSEHKQCQDYRSYPSQIYPYNFTGARPKTYAFKRPTALEDEHKKAKHRARNILANALPISPVSSGASTPASSVPRPYMASMGSEKCQVNSEIMPELHSQFERRRVTNTSDQNGGSTHKKFSRSPPVECRNFLKCEEVSGIIELEINRDSPLMLREKREKRSGSSKSSERTSCGEPQGLFVESQSSRDNPNSQTSPWTASLQVSAEITGNENYHQKRQPKKLSSNKSNAIPASTSNETSRSSSPGMSLTTFALTSEGRGIPGAICFSLHPDQSQNKKNGSSSSSETMAPKTELSISEVHIEPRSPKPERSPIEISTKEHWWSVTEEHFTYPEELVPSVHANETRVNSAYVKLQDNGRKDHVAEQRTARVVSSLELPQSRKTSAEELNFSKNNHGGSNTNMATLSFTPAVNSPTPSSNKSSVESSKANSPPRSADSHLKSLASKNIASAIISYEIAAKGDRIVYSDRLKPTDIVVKTPSISKLPKTSSSGNMPENEVAADRSERQDVSMARDQTKRKTNHLKNHELLDSKGKDNSRRNLCDFPEGVVTNSCKEIICPSCQMIFSKDEHLLFLDHFEECNGPEFVDM